MLSNFPGLLLRLPGNLVRALRIHFSRKWFKEIAEVLSDGGNVRKCADASLKQGKAVFPNVAVAREGAADRIYFSP